MTRRDARVDEDEDTPVPDSPISLPRDFDELAFVVAQCARDLKTFVHRLNKIDERVEAMDKARRDAENERLKSQLLAVELKAAAWKARGFSAAERALMAIGGIAVGYFGSRLEHCQTPPPVVVVPAAQMPSGGPSAIPAPQRAP